MGSSTSTEFPTMASLKELRKEAKDKYNRGLGQKSLKGYGAMSKAALMAKLGKSNEEKRDNRAMASSKTANAIASKLVDGQEGDTAVKRVQAKARLLRAVKRDIDAARKANPDISQEELRKVAGKAFLTEAKAIKEGTQEAKPAKAKPAATKGKAPAQQWTKPTGDTPQKLKPEDLKTAEDRAAYAKQEAEHQRKQGNEKGAKAWEAQAKLSRMAAIKRDLDKGKQEQGSLFGVTEHSSDMPLFAQEDGKPKAKKSTLPEVAKGLHEVNPNELDFDPKRFQYKLVHGSTGASGSLEGVGKWDDNLAGVLQVWRDPKDGKDYVVNGHNRLNLAKKLGAESVAVRYLNVKTPEEARALGALANIAEGRGNALDSAKFFRDSGMTREQLEQRGIPLKEKIATDGIALSRLAPHLFDKVVHGGLSQEQGAIIGKHLDDHESQSKLHDLIEKETKKGRKITNDVIRELAQTVQGAPSHSEVQTSLFGSEETTRNLALEKAELQAAVRQRLSRKKKLFGIVAKSKAAEELAKAGNVIDQGKSKDVSQQAGQVLNIFDELKNKTGPVSAAINKATERIANGEDKKKVIDELHKQLVQEIPQQLGIKAQAA